MVGVSAERKKRVVREDDALDDPPGAAVGHQYFNRCDIQRRYAQVRFASAICCMISARKGDTFGSVVLPALNLRN